MAARSETVLVEQSVLRSAAVLEMPLGTELDFPLVPRWVRLSAHLLG
jgi:hypothetical protein